VILKSGKIAKINQIFTTRSDKIKFSGVEFNNESSFFDYPCNSSVLEIYKVNLTDVTEIKFFDSEIRQKCIRIIKSNKKCIVFPMYFSEQQ
jgi:hypothetical protein